MSLIMHTLARSTDSGGTHGNGGGRHRGTLGSFAQSVWSPSGGSAGRREESYHLLLELCSQEPTMQCCFKIIESTCLARGLDVEIGGKAPSPEFRDFLSRYYVPFAESCIRYFFALGFVPWRLRKLATGDVVPEVVPLGMFTWSIESITNRVSKGLGTRVGDAGSVAGARNAAHHNAVTGRVAKGGVEQMAAEKAFQKRKEYFSDPKRVPYPLQGDAMRMGNRSDTAKGAEKRRLEGYSNHLRNGASEGGGESPLVAQQRDGASKKGRGSGAADAAVGEVNIPSYYRQQEALRRQPAPPDDEESKVLRYCISFTENCDVQEEEVEIYEYMPPTNSITRCSVLYGTVPSPLSHILIDYRNIRTTLIRQAYADAYNTQAKMICSYSAQKNMYNVSEGGPILNSEGWAPQQRLGLQTDTNLPSEIEANAFSRDCLTDTIVGSKQVEHKPVVYSLPKNTSVEQQQKLESIIDVPKLQAKFAKDISCILGVPYEMVYGGYSDDSSGKSRAMHNTKIFITNMMSICKHLELLLEDVYLSAYGGVRSDVKFVIRPTPRIEVNTVEEICMLLEAGVVSFDNAMHLSNMILGIDLQQGSGEKANAGQFSRAFMTPSNKKDLIVAEKAQKKPAS